MVKGLSSRLYRATTMLWHRGGEASEQPLAPLPKKLRD